MANSYYNHGAWPIYKSSGASNLARTEADNITEGFRLVEVDVLSLAGATSVTPFYYEASFTSADLAAGILTVTHNLTKRYPAAVAVYNNSGVKVDVEVTTVSTNSLTIDLSAMTVSGTWQVIVRI